MVKDTTENVYLITIKGRNRFSLHNHMYISIDEFKKRFESSKPSVTDRASVGDFKMRLLQLKTMLAEKGFELFSKNAIDWSMEYV